MKPEEVVKSKVAFDEMGDMKEKEDVAEKDVGATGGKPSMAGDSLESAQVPLQSSGVFCSSLSNCEDVPCFPSSTVTNQSPCGVKCSREETASSGARFGIYRD